MESPVYSNIWWSPSFALAPSGMFWPTGTRKSCPQRLVSSTSKDPAHKVPGPVVQNVRVMEMDRVASILSRPS